MSLYVELLRHIPLIISKPFVAVDMVLLRKDVSFVLVKRAFEPYKGQWRRKRSARQEGDES
ncbi:MAG: hypothetical protein QF829_00305 [Candidatus Hydrothermarchaeota archaeon]|nr:hypothetical protein [Candidatus Hydrothermarchaeota archaeon]